MTPSPNCTIASPRGKWTREGRAKSAEQLAVLCLQTGEGFASRFLCRINGDTSVEANGSIRDHKKDKQREGGSARESSHF